MSDELAQSEARHRGRSLKRHSALRLLLASTVTITLVIGLGAVFFYRHLNENITFLDITDQVGADRPERVAPGKPINVLIMGSDSRAGDQGMKQLENGGARSDTTILMHLSSDRKFAYGVSLPRDAVIERPTCKTDEGTVPAESGAMFNTAFYYGGVACTVKTVESLTGVRIDHWVVVNFNGFKDMVDAIGGVNVCVPHAIDDDQYKMHLKAGNQKIKGQAALDYVRVRHGFGDGSDIGRMKRQQSFIASMAAQVVSAGTLTRVDRLVKFLDAATRSLALDTGVGNILSLAKLGQEFQSIGLDNIQFITVPWEWYEPDPNRIVWNQKLSDRLWKKMRNDEPLSRRLSADAVSAAATKAGKKATDDPSPTSSPSSSPSAQTSEEAAAEAAAEAEANGLCA
ncbi:Cell envelope-related transcriptional attenuator [metagenome]|uniref:Cell envelope-related transcriptional attenuator n=1 Tax=metagenome TaxID=256318 RepID=A0A2P2C753_9ZZZZ